MRIAIYSRVSTPKQSVFPQLQVLRKYANGRPGWKIVRIYRDVYSGASDRRPGLTQLMEDAYRRRFDVVLVFKFDRFARSVRQLVNALEEFNNLGIAFISVSEAIDTTTAYGKLLFTIVAAVGEIERTFINERTARRRQTVYERYKEKGRHWGRPRAIFDREAAYNLRQADPKRWSWRELGKYFGKSKDTIQREVKRHASRRSGG